MGGANYHMICSIVQQIKNRVRRSGGNDQNVTEEKVAIVFQSVLHVGREVELTVKVGILQVMACMCVNHVIL